MNKQPIIPLLLFFFFFSFISSTSAQSEIENWNKIADSLIVKKGSTESHEEKIVLLKQALTYYSKAENWDKIIYTKTDLAIKHYQLSDYLNFDLLLDEIKELIRIHTVSENVYYDVQEVFVWYYNDIEDYETSEELGKQIFEHALSRPDKIRSSRAASNLGFFYEKFLGDSQRAIDYQKKAISLLENSKQKNDSQLALLYSNLGGFYHQAGSYQKAMSTFRYSLRILRDEDKQKLNMQSIWWNFQIMAEIHLANDQMDSCYYFSQKALSILEDQDMTFKDDYQTYHTLSEYYSKIGDKSIALEYLLKGLESAKKKRDVFIPIYALVNLADGLAEQGQSQRALDSLQLGIRLLCPEFNSSDIFKTPPLELFAHKKSALQLLSKRGDIFHQNYQKDGKEKFLTAALSNFKHASEMARLIRQDYASSTSKFHLAKEVSPVYESGLQIAFELFEKSNDLAYIEDAFYFAEQNKSILLLESMKANLAKGFNHLPSHILEQEKNLKLQIIRFEKLKYTQKKQNPTNKDHNPFIIDKLFELKEALQNLIDSIEQQYPQYYQLKYQYEVASLDQVQQKLIDNKTILLEYFVGEKAIFVFCIEKKKVRLLRIDKPENLSDSFTQFKNILSTPPKSGQYTTSLNKFNQGSYSFYQLLLEQALQHSQHQQLIIVPDDLLIYLPFETLNNKPTTGTSYHLNEQNYLLEQFDISYSFSASLLLKTKDVSYSHSKPFIGFAPDFKTPISQSTRTCSNDELYSLKCSQQEVASINQLMNGTTLIQKQASKTTFNSNVKDYNIIHLATHACVDEEDPNFNRIYFSDDYLSNYDLTNMRIEANLAVLSACNTNVGPLMKGDGVSSISKGFILAGCPSVLTSLWSVDDCSTSNIMIGFYESLQKEYSKSSSLRAAKLAYLQQADPEQAHPYFWAPFLLSGQDGAIVSARSSKVWIWSILGLVGLLILVRMFRHRH